MLLKIAILARIPLIREGLRALLADDVSSRSLPSSTRRRDDASERDFQVTTLAPSDELVEDLLAAEPDVLLLDVDVLEREGWDILDELRRALPTLTTLILTDNAQDRRVFQALQLGARGYLYRDASPDEMANAILAAHNGSIVLHPDIARTLIQTVERAEETTRGGAEENESLIEPLSERELDVLRLMTRGMPNKQIAAELFITEHTVKFHIRSILGKLGAANRTEAVTLALQKGLVTL